MELVQNYKNVIANKSTFQINTKLFDKTIHKYKIQTIFILNYMVSIFHFKVTFKTKQKSL